MPSVREARQVELMFAGYSSAPSAARPSRDTRNFVVTCSFIREYGHLYAVIRTAARVLQE